MSFYKGNNLIHVGKGQADHRIRAAIIDGYPPAFGVGQGGAGKSYIGHIAGALVGGLGCQQVWLAALHDFPRLVQVQQGCPKAIDKAVAGSQHPMVEPQPAFCGFDRDGAGPDLG